MVVWCLFFVERCDAGNCCGGLIGKDDIFFQLGYMFFLIGFLGQKQSCNTDLGIKFALIC